MLDVSIIIISYNTRELLRDCLSSVYDQTTESSFEVIVIDNASSDGSVECVREMFPQVLLEASSENLGFARANNLAVERAQGKYILLLNPDTVILDHAIDRLLMFAQAHPQAKIWGGRTLFKDGTLNRTSCYGRPTLSGLFWRAIGLGQAFSFSEFFNPEAFGSWGYDSERQVDIVTGCFFLTEQTFWRQLGGFDEHFFIYGEEVDLCLRARALGARPMFTPDATIIHYGGASEISEAVRSSKVVRAKVAIIKKHWPRWQRWLGIQLLRLWSFSRFVYARFATRCLGKPAAAMDKWVHLWRDRSNWRRGFDG